MIKKLDHLVITTADIKTCLSFYQSLGFDVKEGNGRYELFAGDFKINVHLLGKELSPHAGRVQPGSADLCFELDSDVSAFKKELEEKGIVPEFGIVPRNGVKGPMHSLYLRDPDGNLVEFCQYS